MGDKYNQPNFTNLLSLLGTLLRSGICQHDNVDISDSSEDEDNLVDVDAKEGSDVRLSLLSTHAREDMDEVGVLFELPVRDSWTASRSELSQKILDEVSFTQAPSAGVPIAGGKIISHLCFDNLDLSMKVCSLTKNIFKDRKAEDSHVALRTLTFMLHISDQYSKQRIDFILSVFFAGIEVNAKYETEVLLLLNSLISEIRQRTHGGGGEEIEVYLHSQLLSHLKSIITLAISKNSTPKVKDAAVCLVRYLLPIPRKEGSNKEVEGKNNSTKVEREGIHNESITYIAGNKSRVLVPYLKEEEVKDKVFLSLKDLYPHIYESLSTFAETSLKKKNNFRHANDNGMTYGNRYYPGLFSVSLVDSSVFSEYFVALRTCLIGPQARGRISTIEWVKDIFLETINVLFQIDEEGRSEKRPTTDIAKGEVLLFLECLVDLSPEHCTTALLDESEQQSETDGSRTKNTTKLVEVYVTSSRSSFEYNERYMSHYYRLLLLFSRNSNSFRQIMLSHSNWGWSLRSFVLGEPSFDKGMVYDVILNGTLKYVKECDFFRRNMIEECVFPCINLFVSTDCGGMSQLSSVVRRFHA